MTLATDRNQRRAWPILARLARGLAAALEREPPEGHVARVRSREMLDRMAEGSRLTAAEIEISEARAMAQRARLR